MSTFAHRRNVAHVLGRGFTAREYAAVLEVCLTRAFTALAELEASGMVRRRPNARTPEGGIGRPMTEFDFIPARERPDYQPDRLPEHYPPPELEVAEEARRRFSRGRAVAGVGRQVKASSKNKTNLLRKARRQGIKITQRNAMLYAEKDGQKIPLAHQNAAACGTAKDEKKLAGLGYKAA